ncbi:MAG: hypothetical protein U9R27_01815 [Campylobacterota bacterium]|nr:hypothetical protein [Campylobacterota bacterium]
MQLNELMEEQTADSIAKKTLLSKNVVESLFNKKFESLTQSRALGAITIIEREYGVDLDTLRQEVKEYFADQSSNQSGLMVGEPIVKESRLFSKLLTLILIALLLYGAWYFFAGYYKQKVDPMNSATEKSLITIILEVKDTIFVAKEEEVTESDLPLKEEESIEPTDHSDTSDTVVDSSTDTPEESSRVSSQDPESTTDKNISTVVREKITLIPHNTMWFKVTNLDTNEQIELKRQEKYDIDLSENSWLFATEDALFAFIDNDQFEEFGSEGKLFFKLDQSGIHPLSAQEYSIASGEEIAIEKSTLQEENLSTVAESNLFETVGEEPKIITLMPGEDMWFRMINLTTKKRQAFKQKSNYNIDVSSDEWLFAAQNVNFSFRDDNNTAAYGGRGKLFYKIDQSGIHKLGEDEYRRLSR